MTKMTNWIQRWFCLVFLLLHGLVGLAWPDEPAARRPRVGLALSGGGARGAAHIGVLKILEREGIPIDCIAGVSMGSIVGGLYAMSYSPDEIEKFLEQQDWNEIFSDEPQWRFTPLAERADSRYQLKVALRGWSPEVPGGLLNGQRFTEALDVLTSSRMLQAGNDFDRLPIPFRAVATNLLDGKPYIFRQGSMTQALRASMAVPMMFTPLETENAMLVDGGLVNNLPVEVVRDMGADIIIAVDTSTPLLSRAELSTLFGVIDQAISLQIEKNVEASKKLASIVLRPQLADYSNTRYDKLKEIVQLGSAEAEKHIPELKALVAGIAPRATSQAIVIPEATPIIDTITFSGLQQIPQDQVESRIRLRPGDNADPDAIAAEVRRIYAMRLFESVSYTLEPTGDNHYHLIFRVRENLLNTLGLGIRYDNDYDFTILAELVARQLLGTPSRAVLSSQFGGLENHFASFRYVPNHASFLYFEPKVEVRRLERHDWNNQKLIDTFTDKREGGQFVLGGTFFRQMEFAAGYRIERVRIAGGTGKQTQQGSKTLAGIIGQLNWNTLDSPEYPSSGEQLQMHFDKQNQAFGSDFDYLKGEINYRRYFSLSNKSTLRMKLVLGYSEGNLPFYDMFFIGGYSQSSLSAPSFLGFSVDEIAARQMAIAGVSYYREIFSRPLSVLKRGYVTAAYNSGFFSERAASPYNFQNLNGIGIGLALDTRIGPLRTTLGWGESGRVNFYVSFGPSF